MFENEEIVQKIKEEKTLREMAEDLNISLNDVNQRIMQVKNKGLILKKIIYDNGNIRYLIKKWPQRDSCVASIKLYDSSKFSAMLISDLHFGNELESIEYLDTIYEYCKSYGINIIINGGDLIDGAFSKVDQVIDDPEKQLDYVIKNHPYDKDILNLICLGNHDFSLYKSGIDIKKALEMFRYDLIPLGFGMGILNFGSDQIFIRHFVPEYNFEPIYGKLVLEGHKHKMAFANGDQGFLVNIPTLSNLTLGKQEFPGAVRIDLFFDSDGHINSGHFEQFVIADKLATVNEAIFDLSYLNHDYLSESEIRPKMKKIQTNGQTQIDKFYKRWSQK